MAVERNTHGPCMPAWLGLHE